MIDGSDVYEATKAAFIDAMAEAKTRAPMMHIKEFDAEDESGDPVRVVGIVEDDDMLKFIVVEEGEDGEVYPIVRTEIYRKGTAAGGNAEPHRGDQSALAAKEDP